MGTADIDHAFRLPGSHRAAACLSRHLRQRDPLRLGLWGAIVLERGNAGRDRLLVAMFVPAASLARFETSTDRYGAWAVFIARLLPFVSFDFVSYAAGLARVRFWRFLLATGVGQLPATIVYSLAGDFAAVNLGLLAGGIAFTFVAAAIIATSAGFFRGRKHELA